MRTEARWISRVGVVSLGALLATTVGLRVVHGQAQHVRWDIVSLQFNTPSPGVNTVSPGGIAFATAANPSTLKIKLTGSGTFVAPASGGPSSAVTGGGNWETFSGSTSTGKGSYWVTRLADWEFGTFALPVNVDLVDDGQAANGNAVLLIQYSDGSQGILGVLCHGPGAPAGIGEGVIATKDFVTYVNFEPPAPLVDKNRTVFHIQ